MKRNIIITIIAVIAIVVFIKATPRTNIPSNTGDIPSQMEDTTRVPRPDEVRSPDSPETQTKTITGVILEKDDGCFYDAICRINVGGIWVITNQGWYQGPLGTTAENLAVGMSVEAYGKVVPEGITLLGSSTYYVRTK